MSELQTDINCTQQGQRKVHTDVIRLRKDLEEVMKMYHVNVTFPDEDDITHFIVKLKVEEGFYRNVWYSFDFIIPEGWPFNPPKVKILDKIWHPNIEFVEDDNPNSGKVCLNLIKTSYLPTIRLEEIVMGIKFILIYPNANDAYNLKAADEKKHNYDAFKKNVDFYIEKMNNEDDD